MSTNLAIVWRPQIVNMLVYFKMGLFENRVYSQLLPFDRDNDH